MKKVLSIIASLALAFTLVGCAKEETVTPTPTPQEPTPQVEVDDTVARVAGLKGPTSFSLAKIIADDEAREVKKYDAKVVPEVAEVNVMLEKEELDIAAIPANVASVLYNKLDGAITVLNINTYGVLYILAHGEGVVNNINDLEGKTIYAIGKGGTPEVSLNYLLEQNKINANVEFKTSPEEALQHALKDPESLLMVPEPFVTVSTTKNPDLKVNLSMNEVWKETTGQDLVTGVFVVRTKFLEEHPSVVEEFMKDFDEAVKFTNANIEESAKNIASLGIIPEPVAKKSIARTNQVNITGDDLEKTLSSYLQILHGYNPKTVGGKLPGEDFYYKK